jgi:nicotinamidase-related amidase
MGITTLLILDIEKGILDMVGDDGEYLERLSQALNAARENNIKVIHVITAFRPGYPESHPSNPSVSGIAAAGLFVEGDPTTEVDPTVAPIDNEVVITKRRVSAFFGTELDMILRCYNTERIAVAGISTSGAVLSTIRHASDLDYKITLLCDLCRERDEETHNFLINKIFKRKINVLTSDEWIQQLSDESTTEKAALS